jgi:hypothetical protein
MRLVVGRGEKIQWLYAGAHDYDPIDGASCPLQTILAILPNFSLRNALIER